MVGLCLFNLLVCSLFVVFGKFVINSKTSFNFLFSLYNFNPCNYT